MTMSIQEQTSDEEFEIKFYRGIIRRRPDFFEALSVLGDLYTQCGRYEEGLEIDKRLARLRPGDPFVLYNLACSYSLTGEIPKAFTAIKRALSLGYSDLEYLQKDEDLANLRQDQDFQDYFVKVWQKALNGRIRRADPTVTFKDG